MSPNCKRCLALALPGKSSGSSSGSRIWPVLNLSARLIASLLQCGSSGVREGALPDIYKYILGADVDWNAENCSTASSVSSIAAFNIQLGSTGGIAVWHRLAIEKSSNSLSRSGVAENPGKADGLLSECLGDREVGK